MTRLNCVELKTFVPAKDFEVSKLFYLDMGFEQRSEAGGVAYFCHGACSFLLQNDYHAEHAQHMTMHLLVDDVQAWHAQLALVDLAARYGAHGVHITPIQAQAWGITEFVVIDPSDVCWHIGQNTPNFEPIGRLPSKRPATS